MLSWPNDAGRNFESIRADLDNIVSRLQKNIDPTAQKKLLRELRLLLDEADHLLAEESDS